MSLPPETRWHCFCKGKLVMIKHMPVKDSGHKHSIEASEGEDHPQQEHEAVQQQADIVAIVHVTEAIQ